MKFRMDKVFKNYQRIVFLSLLVFTGAQLQVYAQPANDNCGSAQLVTPGLSIAWDNTGATADGNPDVLCAPSGRPQIYSDIWYQFTPVCNGTATFTTVGTFALDTKIAVYDSLCPGAIIDCNDDDPDCGGCLQSAITWNVISGTTYLLRLGLYDSISGQGAGTFDLIVTDSIAPSITCAVDQQDSTDVGVCSAVVTVAGPTVSDACGFTNVTNDYNGTADASDTYPEGVTTVTWYAMDFTDTASCVQTITIIDDENPSITCAGGQNQTADAGLCLAAVTVTGPSTNDNCMVVTVINSHTGTADASGNYPVGITTVTWTVTDTSGNSATCAQDITVTDDEDPTITCPANIIIPLCGSFTVVPVPSTSDNCNVASVINTFNGTGNATDTYPLDTTFVTWTVTDIYTNTSSCTMWILRNESPAVDISPDPAFACVATDYVLNGNPIPGSGTIILESWVGPGLLPPSNQSAVTFNVGVPGTLGPIAFTVTDDNGCTATDNISINVLDNPSANIVPTIIEYCEGDIEQLEGNPVAGAGTIISHNWTGDTGPLSATNIPDPVFVTSAPGTYNLTYTVMDDNGCSGVDNVVVVVNTKPFVNITPSPAIVCQSNPLVLNGNLVVGSGSIASQIWTGDVGQLSATNIPNPTFDTDIPGNYSLTYTVKDNNFCSATDNGFVIVVPGPNVVVTPDTEICKGASVTLSASGGTSYLWNTGAPTASINVTPDTTTTYSVTVTAGNGCTLPGEVTVTVNPNPTAEADPDTAICNGANVLITAVGGVGYNWSSGQATSTILVSPASTTVYNVTVTDVNGCTATDNATVTVNSNPTATAFPDTAVCDGADVTLSSSGGSNYSWNTGAGTQSIIVTPSSTTTYSVTATDGNGCSATDDVAVIVNALPAVVAFPDTAICEGSTVVLTATGGVSYSWDLAPPTPSVTVSPVITTTYNVTATDANSCMGTASVIVTVNTNPTVVASQDVAICEGSSVVLSASGGVSYNWNPGGSAQSITVSPATAQNYSVTATDANGCSGVDDVDVSVNTNPTASAGPDTAVCQGSAVLLTAQGGSTYQWSTGSAVSSTTVFPATTTNYQVTVTDGNGCTDVATVLVQALDQPTAGYLASATCFGDTTFFTDLSTGTDIGSIYQIDFYNDGSLDLFVPPGDTAFLIPVYGDIPFRGIVVNANGCTDTMVNVLSIDTVPNVSFSGLDPVYCVNTNVVQLAGSPVGGSFTGPGISGSNFVSFFAGPGSWDIIYTYTTPNGCAARDTQEVMVQPLTSVSIGNLSNKYCSKDAPVTMQGMPMGGTFVGAGVSGSQFNPGAAFIGINPVTYSFIDVNGCLSTTTTNVEVTKSPNPVILGLTDPLCEKDNPVALTGSPMGGSFSGAGVTGNIFNQSIAGVGQHTINYLYTDAHGCEGEKDKIVQVYASPSAEITGLDSSYCVNDPATILVGVPPGGSFSGIGVIGDYYDPALAGTGAKYDVFYEYVDSNGCSNIDTQFVAVLNSPFVEIVDLETEVCIQRNKVTLVGFPAGGTFTGASISDSIFYPSEAGAGLHTIVYSFRNSIGCTEIVKATIRVDKCTGIEDVNEFPYVRVFPNPSTGKFTIEVNEIYSEGELSLFNIEGKEVYRDFIEGGSGYLQEVDLSMSTSGIYYIKLKTSTHSIIKKMVIRR